MAARKGPWSPRSAPGRGRLVVAITLAGLLGLGLWLLTEMFPGRVSGDGDWSYFVRLLAGLLVIGSSFIFIRRVGFGEVARNLAIWMGIAAVLMLGYTYQNELRDVWLRVRSELVPGYPVATGPNTMKLTEGLDRHFTVVGTANGTAVRFLIDTGASDIVLSPADARRIGIDFGTLEFSRLYQTANGVGRGAAFTLDTLAIGPVQLRGVRVSVNQADMGASLLGMSFLRTLASVEIQGRDMYLRWN
jgi:aspartyl protease family protein